MPGEADRRDGPGYPRTIRVRAKVPTPDGLVCDSEGLSVLADDAAIHGSADPSHSLTKVRFALDVDEDDWPPFATESVWAEPLGGDRFRLNNTPWFARGFSMSDVVLALPDEDDILWVREPVEHGGRLTVRVIPLPDGPLAGSCDAVINAFTPLGVDAEGAEPAFPIVALDIPGDADFGAILRLLRDGEADGRWAFEEGLITDAWRAL